MRLASVRLLVDDFDGCHQFYATVLGLAGRFGPGGPYEEFATGSPDVSIGLFDRKLMAAAVPGLGTGGGDPVVIALAVPDVDRAVAEVTGRGAVVVSPPTDQPAWRLRVAHVRDPAGNLVELIAPLGP